MRSVEEGGYCCRWLPDFVIETVPWGGAGVERDIYGHLPTRGNHRIAGKSAVLVPSFQLRIPLLPDNSVFSEMISISLLDQRMTQIFLVIRHSLVLFDSSQRVPDLVTRLGYMRWSVFSSAYSQIETLSVHIEYCHYFTILRSDEFVKYPIPLLQLSGQNIA